MNYALIDQGIIDSLIEIAEGDPAFLRELQSLYLKQYREKAPEIERLAKAGELAKVAATVHTIKSSSGILGAMNFHDFCASLEKSSRDGDAAAVSALLPAFQEAFAQANKAIQEISGAKKAA
jgi:HPt (histidine-containing phosphotransfer) domain-containing protein